MDLHWRGIPVDVIVCAFVHVGERRSKVRLRSSSTATLPYELKLKGKMRRRSGGKSGRVLLGCANERCWVARLSRRRVAIGGESGIVHGKRGKG